MKNYGYTLMIFLLTASQMVSAQEKEIFVSDQLTKLWETPAVFSVPESVCHDPLNNVLYVANINGKPTEKDGNGFISKLSLEGETEVLEWVSGLHAPKGMGVFDNKLFVTDIDRVAEIDILSGKITRFYEFPESKFLNDIAIGLNGAVYISDMMSTRVYRIYDGQAETWLDDETLTGPNGLFFEGNELLIGCKKIVRVDTGNKAITLWVENTGGIDGLEGTGDGRYLFSDWQGSVYLVGEDKNIEKLLDTSGAEINAADIEYIPGLNLLLVPTFFDNRVMAYKLN